MAVTVHCLLHGQMLAWACQVPVPVTAAVLPPAAVPAPAPVTAAAPAQALTPSGGCKTVLGLLQSTPELSDWASTLQVARVPYAPGCVVNHTLDQGNVAASFLQLCHAPVCSPPIVIPEVDFLRLNTHPSMALSCTADVGAVERAEQHAPQHHHVRPRQCRFHRPTACGVGLFF